METQDQTDCSKIQYVQSIEFSPDDFMWIVDVDRKYFNDPTAADNSCPPKMVLVDIKSGSIVDADAFSCVPEALRACTQRQAPDNNWWRALSPP